MKNNMLSRARRILHRRKGVSLIELIVSAALLAMFAASLAALISPFTNMFLRLQNLNHAHIISDTVLDHIRAEVLHAQGYIRLYPAAPAGDPGALFTGSVAEDEIGSAVEFKNEDGYVQLIDAGGCPPTTLKNRKGEIVGADIQYNAGRLLMRYFVFYTGTAGDAGSGYYYYREQAAHSYVARAMTPVYDERFYVGNTIGLEFKIHDIFTDAQGRLRADALAVTVIVYKNGAELYNQTEVFDLALCPVLRTDASAMIDLTA